MRAASFLFLVLLASTASAQEVVRFPGADGFELEARYVASSVADAPVAICLHQYRSDKDSWKPLLPALQDAGFTTLAIDQRGHGGSTRKGQETVKVEDVPPEKFGELLRRGPEDVKAALTWLRSKGNAAKQVVLFGSSYGCSVALLTHAQVPEVKALVLLSPGEEYFGVDVRPALNAWNGPLLVVSMTEDTHHKTAMDLMTQCVKAHRGQDEAGPRWHFVEYEGEGHGTSALELRQKPQSVQQNSADRKPSTEELFKLKDPRRLILTWLVEGAGLGTLPPAGH